MPSGKPDAKRDQTAQRQQQQNQGQGANSSRIEARSGSKVVSKAPGIRTKIAARLTKIAKDHH